MMDNKETRDVLDVSSAENSAGAAYPEENMPKSADRPVVSPQEGGYFLNKFLEKSEDKEETSTESEKPIQADVAPAGTVDELRENIVAALQEIYDPEIPVNIYELGLIYEVNVAEDFTVDVKMTLTTPHCPVAETMPGEVEMRVAAVAGVKSVEVKLVWEPAWDMSKMSDEARLELGLL
ncbi:MAG: SUF system Fe-S cluster assembly protein [Kordiimonas sp.]